MRTWVSCVAALVVVTYPARASAAEDRWWPAQSLPQSVVRTTSLEQFPAPHGPHHMLVQSVAGLAAQAVNEGRGVELVWVTSRNPDLEAWLNRFIAEHPRVALGAALPPWDLVDRYVRKGLVQGYVLYRWDTSPGKIAEDPHRPGIDNSVNVATSIAGLVGGVLVDESLEQQAQTHGLKLLADARGKSAAWCFETYRDQFNRRMICLQDPRIPNCRDLAMAHRAFTLFGLDDPAPAAMQWLEPLSPVLGWSGGDEFQATRLSSVCGHIQTATNWCMNLPVLMAGAEHQRANRVPRFNPRTIDFSDRRSAVSFISSDGDNVQWYEGNFFRPNSSYWGSPDRGRIPFGWSCCFSELTQLCPQVIAHALETRTGNDWFVEWGGGYYYPDLFGLERPDRWDLLARHARRTAALMNVNGTRVIGFNVWRYDSPEALRAYEIIAREAESLLGILVFQYAPYEAGAGQTLWVKDRHGHELPVVTARYSIWGNANNRPRCGTPAKIAREICEGVAEAGSGAPRYDWVIAHVWSYFRHAPGEDEEAENMVQETAADQGGHRGYTPVVWCAERLPENIRVVCPEELLWRIRMQHDAGQTAELIREFE